MVTTSATIKVIYIQDTKLKVLQYKFKNKVSNVDNTSIRYHEHAM